MLMYTDIWTFVRISKLKQAGRFPPIARASIVLLRNDGRLQFCLASVTSVAQVFDRSHPSRQRVAHAEDVSTEQHSEKLCLLEAAYAGRSTRPPLYLEHQLLKVVPLKGIVGKLLSFEEFVTHMKQQARAQQRLRSWQDRRRRMAARTSP